MSFKNISFYSVLSMRLGVAPDKNALTVAAARLTVEVNVLSSHGLRLSMQMLLRNSFLGLDRARRYIEAKYGKGSGSIEPIFVKARPSLFSQLWPGSKRYGGKEKTSGSMANFGLDRLLVRSKQLLIGSTKPIFSALLRLEV